MAKQSTRGEASELTYPLGTAARLTGLSPDVLRAWERRYGVVEPLRTPGGTRRYRASDLERLRLLKAAVAAGHRIGHVARLDAQALAQRGQSGHDAVAAPDEALFDALERLDAVEAERLLSLQLSVLGPTRFARDYTPPLLEEIGQRWVDERLCVASEHLATSLLRGLLGAALRPSATSLAGPRTLFATPAGEPHELGLLIAALIALGAGANAVYLGADLPEREILGAMQRGRVDALALSLVTLPAAEAQRVVRTLRAALPREVPVWIGGRSAAELPDDAGVERFASAGAFEHAVALLALRHRRP